ncbi:MAG: nucleoside-diphosphate sugar epimerase [Chloroflexi bacterium]|nr:nucleoside-diphosphate sugar epimerase [Chloroflexota bacterium]|tara:strand:+ start:10496 stop:11455 length:960 start_codon:yes stop_codon:yes gene_type:complete
MRALITGAAGMYGTALIRRLLGGQPEVSIIAVDDFSRNFPGENPLAAISHEGWAIEVVQRDYAELTTDELERWSPDVVVHFAARISVPESMDDPHGYFQNNEIGTFRFAHAIAGMANPPLLIYASSPEVYGVPVRVPMSEDHPLHPVTVYAATKAASEMHCMALHRWWGHPVVVIRNFNTFGPHQNIDGHAAVLVTFARRALLGEPLQLENGGHQTRDFMFVEDAVDAYVRVIEKGKVLAGSTFNIGTGQETSIREVAQTVVSLSKSASEIVDVPGRPADLPALCADASRIRAVTGWVPRTPFEDGVRRTLEWLRAIDQ